MYCWSYAREWSELQRINTASDGGDALEDAGVKGPIFVSIGTPQKLETFLELNPNVRRGSILVDDYDHKLYKNLGFSRFDEVGMDRASEISALKKRARGESWVSIKSATGDLRILS